MWMDYTFFDIASYYPIKGRICLPMQERQVCSPEKANGNPLQHSCLGSPTDRGAWWAAVHGVAKELNMT